MGKIILRTVTLLILLLAPTAGHAAQLSWTLPTSYADGTPIDPADVERIVVEVYAGPSRTGPWKEVAKSLPGASSIGIMDPDPGHVLWYTAKARLHGAESGYAVPVRKINLSIPIVPTIKPIMKWLITPRKTAFLGCLILLAGVAAVIRRRRRNTRGTGADPTPTGTTTPSE